jgi:tripartite-type tricarboxylate transporter receptor subunit TctC
LRAIIAALVAALSVMSSAPALAQTEPYPSKPVRIMMPFPPGGPGDMFARVIAQKLTDQLGKQFYVENRPGAAGTIGTGIAARSSADGHTLLAASSAMWVNASLYQQMPYDPVKDFDPIIIAAMSPEVMVVHPSVPANTLQELIALVRAGKYNQFAHPGVGTPPQLSTELFRHSLKLDVIMVPFNGGGPMAQSVVAGHTPIAISSLPSVAAMIKSGLLRALAVTSTKRIPMLPDVPTMEEAGVPGQEQEAPQCLWAPAGTPKPIVDLLYREIAKAVEAPDLKEKFAAVGFIPAAIGPAEFAAVMKADMAKWAKVIKDANIRP